MGDEPGSEVVGTVESVPAAVVEAPIVTEPEAMGSSSLRLMFQTISRPLGLWMIWILLMLKNLSSL